MTEQYGGNRSGLKMAELCASSDGIWTWVCNLAPQVDSCRYLDSQAVFQVLITVFKSVLK